MPNRIPPETILQALTLLQNTTLTHRQIAQKLQISRGSITDIASGKRKPYPPTPHKTPPQQTSLLPTGPRQRCPTCGTLTPTPCYACHIRQLKAAIKALGTITSPTTLKLQLEGDDKTRYEELIKARQTTRQQQNNTPNQENQNDEEYPS